VFPFQRGLIQCVVSPKPPTIHETSINRRHNCLVSCSLCPASPLEPDTNSPSFC
jgi:hypothetical protein